MQGLLPALPVRPAKKLRWTGRATDLVELLYALDTYGCINDGEIGIEELADAFSEILGVEIKNTARMTVAPISLMTSERK